MSLASSTASWTTTTYDLSLDTTRYEIAKDVAAFANAIGGTVVVGVKEQHGNAVRLEGVRNVPTLLQEVAVALKQHYVPVPSTPEEHTLVVSPVDPRRLLIPGT